LNQEPDLYVTRINGETAWWHAPDGVPRIVSVLDSYRTVRVFAMQPTLDEAERLLPARLVAKIRREFDAVKRSSDGR